jgi:GntR family transcriptional regulator, transcriptional repressor for pyruvate dehydrogenase complex
VPLDYMSVVTSSVAKQISEQIREAIVSGELQVGQRLPTEDDLAQRYGVSRPTIREALKRLAAQNLIRSQRGPTGGNFVAVPNSASYAATITSTSTLLVSMGAFDFDEIAKARFEMEALCCRLAAENWQAADMETLETAFTSLRAPQISDEEFCAADVRFHRAIADATRNGPIRFVMYAVIEALLPVTNLVVFRLRERKKVIGLHERMLAGLRNRDAAPAIEALDELVEYLREQCERRVNRQGAR